MGCRTNLLRSLAGLPVAAFSAPHVIYKLGIFPGGTESHGAACAAGVHDPPEARQYQ